MNDIKFLIVALTMLAAWSPAWANLGDGSDRIDDLYGNLIKRHLLDDGTVSLLYHKDRYLYEVTFANSRSVLERYSRIDDRDLSPKEISKFLKANAARATWTQHDASKERKFERSDHKAEATYLNVDDRPTLTVRALDKSKSQKVD